MQLQSDTPVVGTTHNVMYRLARVSALSSANQFSDDFSELLKPGFSEDVGATPTVAPILSWKAPSVENTAPLGKQCATSCRSTHKKETLDN